MAHTCPCRYPLVPKHRGITVTRLRTISHEQAWEHEKAQSRDLGMGFLTGNREQHNPHGAHAHQAAYFNWGHFKQTAAQVKPSRTSGPGHLVEAGLSQMPDHPSAPQSPWAVLPLPAGTRGQCGCWHDCRPGKQGCQEGHDEDRAAGAH